MQKDKLISSKSAVVSNAVANDIRATNLRGDDWHSPVFIGLGSNLGERATNLRLARSALESCSSIVMAKCSCLYSSLAMYDTSQPDFLNMVCQCKTLLKPLDLLTVLKSIESELGRIAGTKRFASRPIDLDIIYYEDLLFSQRGLDIPHPRLYERPFVLNPLSEIAPNFLDPLRACSVASLQRALQGRKNDAVRL